MLKGLEFPSFHSSEWPTHARGMVGNYFNLDRNREMIQKKG